MREPAQAFETAVEFCRAGRPEAVHRAAAAVAEAGGGIVATLGDPEAATYWRSTAKPFQAMPLIERGALREFGISDAELAVICASHDGEEQHVEVVRALMERTGVQLDELRCGAHPPMSRAAAHALIRAGREPGVLHNNCSGKHVGMLLLARQLGAPLEGYLDPGGPVQRTIARAVAAAAGGAATDPPMGVDGCSAPTFHLPLTGLARAYARLAAALAAPGEEGALGAIARAMHGQPVLLAGPHRMDTCLMTLPGDTRIIAKVGADGVYALALSGPAGTLGIALRVADGSLRARRALVPALLEHLGLLTGPRLERVLERFPRRLVNHAGVEVGEIRCDLSRLRGTGTGKVAFPGRPEK